MGHIATLFNICISEKPFKVFLPLLQFRRQLRGHVRPDVPGGPPRRNRADERRLLRALHRFSGKG